MHLYLNINKTILLSIACNELNASEIHENITVESKNASFLDYMFPYLSTRDMSVPKAIEHDGHSQDDEVDYKVESRHR